MLIAIIVLISMNLGLASLLGYLIYLVKKFNFTVTLDASVSLDDIIISLERAAKLAASVAKELEINIAEARQQFSRLVVLLDRLQIDVTSGAAGIDRMEIEAGHVAENLAGVQEQARLVDSPDITGTAADSAATGAKRTPRPRKRAT